MGGKRHGHRAISPLTAASSSLSSAVVRSWLAALITVAIYDRSPSHAGAPFVTDDPEPTEFGRFEIDLAAQYAARSGERSGGDGQRLTVSPRWDVPDATA